MPQVSRLKLPPLDLGKETLGQRLSRLRKERGYSQVELAAKMGLTQALITAYERNTRRLHAELVVRFAKTFEVSTDELLLGKKTSPAKSTSGKASLKIIRRLQRIESLPDVQQKTVLKSLDLLLGGVEQSS